MEQYRKQLIRYLQEDDELMSMLAANPPWFAPDDDADVQYSIIPMLDNKLNFMPYITVKMGNEVANGYNLVDAFVLIRCYNGLDKSYYDIDRVMSRLKALLNRHVFTFDSGSKNVNVNTLYEITSAELIDEGWQQRFREQQYRMMVI